MSYFISISIFILIVILSYLKGRTHDKKLRRMLLSELDKYRDENKVAMKRVLYLEEYIDEISKLSVEVKNNQDFGEEVRNYLGSVRM